MPGSSLKPWMCGKSEASSFSSAATAASVVASCFQTMLTLRAGLNHCDEPIPNSQTLLNIVAPAVVQNHLSLGATRKLANQSELTVAYVHAFSQTVNGFNSIPVGLGGGNANLTMHEDSIGVSYGW